jgi:hypothetical protein
MVAFRDARPVRTAAATNGRRPTSTSMAAAENE